MYPERMRWVDVHLMRFDLDTTVDLLHDSRMIQSMETSRRPETGKTAKFLEAKTNVDRLIEFLAPMERIDTGFLKRYLKKEQFLLEVGDGASILEEVARWLNEQETRVKPLRKEMSACEEDLNYLKELRSKMLMLSGLELDLSKLSRFQRVRAKVGTTRRYEELKSIVDETGADLSSSLLDKKEGLHAVRIIYTSTSSKQIEERLRGRVFSEINLDMPRIRDLLKRRSDPTSSMEIGPAELVRELDRIEEKIGSKLDDIKEEGSRIASKLLNPARGWSEVIGIEIEKERMKDSTGSTVYTSRISGWVPESRMKDLKEVILTSTGGSFHIGSRPPSASEIKENKVPTRLKNSGFGSLFEPLTNTFAVPKYNEIDPSIFISVPFVLFFGLMLGDAGYGLLMLIPSVYIYFKGRSSETLRMVGSFGILMGGATTLAGIWMGSFFGDLVPRLIMGDPEGKLFSLTLLGMDLPYDTLRDPMLLFQLSLWLGFLQLNLGFLLLGYDRMKKGNIWGFIKGTFSWMLIQGGAVIFLGGILFGWWELAGQLPLFGGLLFLGGTLLLVFEAGFMFMFDIEGLVGDWISYTRILALGLSTFGLAMAFNIVGEMLVDVSVILIPVVAVLLIVLHVFNMLLQTLGAAVHSIRLQFVEFFGRFYEGGGELFDPFGIERHYSRSRYVGGNKGVHGK